MRREETFRFGLHDEPGLAKAPMHHVPSDMSDGEAEGYLEAMIGSS